MATAAAPRFLESREAQIDDLLLRICLELQLDATRFKLAEANYQAVGKWLESQNLVAQLKPTIYPQGSMLLGTTVKPLFGDEYDLDFVCELICGTMFFRHPADALNVIEQALRASGVYDPMVERKNRCIRLNYAHDFHMDILPACKDPQNGGTCILVPDTRLSDWTPSNPKGFGSWFDGRARQIMVRTMLDKAAPIPEQEPAERKPPLKLCVQLWKRWRDIFYKSNPEVAPISIVLTTLAGLIYLGEQSVVRAMGNVLDETAKAARSAHPRLVVLNPSNSGEDLSERWDSNPSAYRQFVSGITEFDAQWKALEQVRGIDKIARMLERLFGEEITIRVIEKQTRDIEASRSRNELGIKKASGIITGLGGASVERIRPNTFYGHDDE
jgi:hypothetical protein